MATRNQILRELRSLTSPLRSTAVRAVQAGQAVILAGLRSRCPVGRTHALRESIHETPVRTSEAGASGRVVVGTDHVLPIEFGNAHMPAHPFVRPTAQIDGPRAEAAMAKVIKS